MTMITPSYLGETIEYSSLHACRSTLEDPTSRKVRESLGKHGGMHEERTGTGNFVSVGSGEQNFLVLS